VFEFGVIFECTNEVDVPTIVVEDQRSIHEQPRILVTFITEHANQAGAKIKR
jgi:hypothetical protein